MIAEIAADPALKQQAQALAAPLKTAAWRKPSDAELYGALQPAMLVFRMPAFDDDDERVAERMKAAWLQVIYGQLREFPVEAIKAGIDRVLKEHQFPDFPMPADLRRRIEPIAWEMRNAAQRMQAAVDYDGGAGKVIDAAERERVRQLMADEGWLDANGHFDASRMLGKKGRAPRYQTPSETPQQMAARLRGGQ